MSEPQVIAERGGDLLVMTDEEKRLGFVVIVDDETGEKTWFPETTIDTVLARGYWQQFEGVLTVEQALRGARRATGTTRAVTQYEWTEGGWSPVAVYLFGREMVIGRACPGRPDIAAWVESVRAGARWLPGQNLEDLATQMCEQFSHEEYGTLYEEVEPAPTLGVLAGREFAGLKTPPSVVEQPEAATSAPGLFWSPGNLGYPQQAGGSTPQPAADPTAAPACPACDSSHVARYQYGQPRADSQLEARIRDGQVVLGGCGVCDGQPDFRCGACGFRFRAGEPDVEPLDDLLTAARSAEQDRIQYRDPIAAHGATAVARIAPWTEDPVLGAFAVRVIGRAAGVARREAVAALVAAARSGATAPIRGDAEEELIRLGAARELTREDDFEIEETGTDVDGGRFARFTTRAQESGSFTLRDPVMAALGLEMNPWVDLAIDCRAGGFSVVMKLESRNEVYRREKDRSTHLLSRIRPYELIEVTARAAKPRSSR